MLELIIKALSKRGREESKTNSCTDHQEHDHSPKCVRTPNTREAEEEGSKQPKALSVILRGNHKWWFEYAWPIGSGAIGRCGLAG